MTGADLLLIVLVLAAAVWLAHLLDDYEDSIADDQPEQMSLPPYDYELDEESA